MIDDVAMQPTQLQDKTNKKAAGGQTELCFAGPDLDELTRLLDDGESLLTGVCNTDLTPLGDETEEAIENALITFLELRKLMSCVLAQQQIKAMTAA
jgi:hypothetical protein